MSSASSCSSYLTVSTHSDQLKSSVWVVKSLITSRSAGGLIKDLVELCVICTERLTAAGVCDMLMLMPVKCVTDAALLYVGCYCKTNTQHHCKRHTPHSMTHTSTDGEDLTQQPDSISSDSPASHCGDIII